MWCATRMITLSLMCLAVLGQQSNVGEAPKCENFMLPVCTREYDPVCGTNGQTYANECMLCLEKLENKSNNIDDNVLIRTRGAC